MRLLANAVLPLALLASGAALAQSDWQSVSVLGGKYSVSMPAAPKQDQTPMRAGDGAQYTMHQYLIEKDGRAFVVQSATYPPSVNVSNPRANLQSGLNNAAKGLKSGAWTEVKWVEHQGLIASDAVGSKDDFVIRSYSTLSGPNFITLTYAGPAGTERSPDVERFLSSLRVAR